MGSSSANLKLTFHPDHSVGANQRRQQKPETARLPLARPQFPVLPLVLDCRVSCLPALASSHGGDGGRRSPEHLAMAGRNLWLLGIWVEQNVLEKIPFYYRYKEFTDESTNAPVPELCLER
jgi:hypothetical protein